MTRPTTLRIDVPENRKNPESDPASSTRKDRLLELALAARSRLAPAGRATARGLPAVKAGFDAEQYLAANPDVREAGVDPWAHFVQHGMREGRRTRPLGMPHVTPVPRRQPAPVGERVTAYTSINFAYLDRALVLADSVRLHHPDWHLVLVLVEPSVPDPALTDAMGAFDEVLLAPALFGPDFESWVFSLNVVEACTAVKGQALVELLGREDCDQVIYLDPDIWVLRPLAGVLADLSVATGVLTPHVLTPASTLEAIWDGEVGSLKHGVFNLGFLGVRDTPEGRDLASWWAQRLWMACWDAPEKGLFTDQKWMNLAPVFFPGIKVLRDPGLNAASWNLNARRITRAGDGYESNGSPLTFFHFTKAETVGPQMTALHASGSEGVAALWSEYLSALAERRRSLPAIPSWGFGSFLDGSPITEDVRLAFRADPGNAARIPDPFANPAHVRRLAPAVAARWRVW